MLIQGQSVQTVSFDTERQLITIIDQTRLPFVVEWLTLQNCQDAVHAIATMQVRGAPAIGVVAAYGMALALKASAKSEDVEQAATALKAARPTAVNLAWAVDRMLQLVLSAPEQQRYDLACEEAHHILLQDIDACSRIGDHGLELIRAIADRKAGETVNILTHCNAGWLATVDWGTALAPIYKAHQQGIAVHVWVDETRPRNQGALLTCFELSEQGIPHTLICDNSGGHLMQRGQVDMCLVGSDRTTATGDVCNKIGTYLKALAAHDNQIPFYVALPVSTIDWSLQCGFDIPIEERSSEEVLNIQTQSLSGDLMHARVAPVGTQAANPAFDVTPARYVSALITEHGVFTADDSGMEALRAAISS